jgi:ABC-type transport system involved in multi-copper enzyme maturation permease subunit
VTLTERLITLVDNPLIVKDGVSRMRSWRAPLILSIYLGLLGAFGYAFFVITILDTPANRPVAAQVGATVFISLAIIQLSLVSLFAPALAAGAISGERERQTFDILLVTRLSALEIVWGKLVASVAFMLLLILAALPLFAAVFLFGGIDFGQFVTTQLLTVTTAVSLGAVSLLLSAAFRRTLPSTVVAYGVAFAGTIGTLVLGLLFNAALALDQPGALSGSGGDTHPLLFVNPFYALYTVLTIPNGHPMAIGRLVQLLFFVIHAPPAGGPTIEPWQATVLAQAALTVLSLLGAVQLVQGRRTLPRAAGGLPGAAASVSGEPGETPGAAGGGGPLKIPYTGEIEP